MLRLLVAALILLTAFPTIAQFEDREIPACTQRQALGAVRLVRDTGMSEEIEAALGSLAEAASDTSLWSDLLASSINWNETWYEDVVPNLPRCTFAMDFAQIYSRYLSEMELAALYYIAGTLAGAYSSSDSPNALIQQATRHLDTVASLSLDINDMLTRVIN